MGFFAKSAQNAALPEKWRRVWGWKAKKSLPFQPHSPTHSPFCLSAFCLGVLLCNSLFAQTEAGPSKAERLFNAMRVNVQLLQSIEAGIRMDVHVLGSEYSARGKYEEQRLANPPPGDFQRSMYRLDLNFVMGAPTIPGSEPNRMTIVCHPTPDRDKGRFWQYTSIEGEKSVKFVRLAVLEDRIQQKGKQSLIGTVVETKNWGGLAGTLKQITNFYEFTDSPKETVMEGGESQHVWKIAGTLRPVFWEKMVKAFGGLERRTLNYPRQMPTDIEIFIGKDDVFPYKIEYQNRPQEDSPKRTMLTRIVYFDVSLNGEPIPEFKFSAFDKGELPEGVFQADDDTERMIQSLGL